MVGSLDLNLITGNPLSMRDQRLVLLELLRGSHGSIVPARYGAYEPLRAAFDPSKLDDVLACWRSQLLWKRRRPLVEGSAFDGEGECPRRGWVTLAAERGPVPVAAFVRFLQEGSVQLRADFGFVHRLVWQERPAGVSSGTVFCLDPSAGLWSLHVPPHLLLLNIPELYWATLFGPAYVAHFGRRRLLAAPAPVVTELAPDVIYVQLSASPHDLETAYSDVDGVRRRVKEHLGQQSFFDASGRTERYAVPAFP